MDEDREVSASEGTISGCTSSGGAAREGEYAEGSTLTLTETPAEGSHFSGWGTPQCEGSTATTCEVTIGSADEAVSASFAPEPLPEYKLTTHSEGGGHGTIECAPPGGTCGAEREYVKGTAVTLTASPAGGSEFVEWTGACTGTLLPLCEVTIEEATDVGAIFELIEHTLTVSVSGEGEVNASEGTVSGCTSTGGAACEGEYAEGATLTLTETPAEGSHFSGWGTPQCDESTATTCEITIGSGDEAVAATFAPSGPSGPPLTVAIEEGEGTVVSDPAGLECTGEAPHSCETEEIAEGTVTLTASPAPGYLFKSWRKCDSGGVHGRQCTIELNEAKEVGAKFTKAWSLQASKAGGQGTLTTSPGGLSCGYVCLSATALYKQGSVTVKEKPARHFHFVEFTGAGGSAGSCEGATAETCTFTIAEDSSLEALFAEDEKNTLSVAKEGGGQGSVKTKPSGLNCTYTCNTQSAAFYEGEVVEVSWKLNKGTTSVAFGGEAGDCPASSEALEGSCHVTMDEAHSLVATFE